MKYGGLLFANLFRKKVRLALTLGSFAAALFLFTFLAVVKSAFSRGVEVAGADRLVVINRTSIIQPLPLAYYDKMMAIPGIKAITHANWFGGVYQEEKNFFPQMAVDIDSQRLVYPEIIIPDDQWKAFINDRQGAVVGARTAKRFGWKIGDRIPIKSTLFGGNSAWEFNIDGIFTNSKPGGDESAFWFQWKYFDENMPADYKGNVGWYVIRLNSPDDAERVAKTIDGEFTNSNYETKTETESAFQAGWAKQFGNIEFLILSIGTVVFFTLLLVTGNTMAIAVRERTAELAVLKAVGFSDRAVLTMVLLESMLVAVIGGALGLLFAALAVPVLASALNGLLPVLVVSYSTLLAGIGFALAVGAFSGMIPAFGAMRLRVVDALRRV